MVPELSSSGCVPQCFLACHKRCLETLAIQCGHKKLQGRLQLFGREFSQVSSCASDGIPFIITKCISEIERRALRMKVRERAPARLSGPVSFYFQTWRVFNYHPNLHFT